MAKIFDITTFKDTKNGNLSVLENVFETDIKRLYYLHGLHPEMKRGGHRMKQTRSALICLSGSCMVHVQNPESKQIFELNSPEKALLLEPEDWRLLTNFAENTLIISLANTYYDPEEYIYKAYL